MIHNLPHWRQRQSINNSNDMRKFSLRFILFSLIIVPLSACGSTKLIDIPKSTAVLSLSEKQREITHPKMEVIRDLVEDYKFEKSELSAAYHRYQSNSRLSRVSRYEGGGPNRGIRREWNELRGEVRSFIRQRQEFIKEIAELVEEIKANLSPEQLVTFEAEIKLPELELPEMLKRRRYDEFLFIPGSRMGTRDDF